MTTESQILSNVMDKTRQLTGIYMKLLRSTDLHHVFEADGKKLNSAFWIIAHLSVTENFLLLRSTGGEHIKIPWARQFGLGSVLPPREECPPLEEIMGVFENVHQKAIAHVASLQDDFLNAENTTGFEFAKEKTV